jgi:hypothetical protein
MQMFLKNNVSFCSAFNELLADNNDDDDDEQNEKSTKSE